MALFIIRRFLQSLIVLFVMSVIIFLGIYSIGDPVEILVSPQADQIERARIIASLGLDQPLWVQYLSFLRGAAAFDLGTSFVFNVPAIKLIFDRLPATLELAIASMTLAVAIGLPLGFYCGVRPNSPVSKTLMSGSILGFSLPGFWVGLMLVLIFSVNLGWLPSHGRGDVATVFGITSSLFTLDGISHIILPALNLSLFNMALIMRLTRAGVVENMLADYVKFARAKGLGSRRILGVHVLKSVLPPIVTVVAMQMGELLAFTVVTETIFSWPGIGKLLIDSIYMLDRPVVVAYLLCVLTMFVILNLLVDLIYPLLDPRVKI